LQNNITKTAENPPMLQITEIGHTKISSRPPSTLQDDSITTQKMEYKLSITSMNIFHNGRRKPKISVSGSTSGCVKTEKKDLVVCVTIRNQVTAFSKLCRNSIVPRYLILETISQVSIQSKSGPNKLEAVALRTGTFLYKSKNPMRTVITEINTYKALARGHIQGR
jgi:hypothetical protein